MRQLAQWKQRIKSLRDDTGVLYFACRHPLTPWYAKVFAVCVVAYLFCPLDLIPDPIPILGQLDDLIIVPLGIIMVRALIPEHIFAECRVKANALTLQAPRWRLVVAAMIVSLWVLAIWLVGTFLWNPH